MRILVLNQSFHPDVVAVAQYASELAAALVEAGHEVTVVVSARGYDDPALRFPRREVWNGVRILRVPSLGFGKGARWRRALDFASFLVSCSCRLILLSRFDLIVAMTSPPLVSFVATLFARIKGGRMISWVMDLNPDEAIAAGWLDPNSSLAAMLERILCYTLRCSERIVVHDEFVKARVAGKGVSPSKIVVVPPWSNDPVIRYDEGGREAFRREFGLAGKFVVMYSGNHSPCHPLDTLLDAARRLADHPRLAFCFVGGGSEFVKVREFAARHALRNITCIPYQPREKLSGSLSAADLHVVVMGNAFVGIVHSCKIYNILRLGIPFLYVGPEQSHIVDILPAGAHNRWAFVAQHGDVAAVRRHILAAADGTTTFRSLEETALGRRFSMEELLPVIVRLVDSREATPPAPKPCGSAPTHG